VWDPHVRVVFNLQLVWRAPSPRAPPVHHTELQCRATREGPSRGGATLKKPVGRRLWRSSGRTPRALEKDGGRKGRRACATEGGGREDHRAESPWTASRATRLCCGRHKYSEIHGRELRAVRFMDRWLAPMVVRPLQQLCPKLDPLARAPCPELAALPSRP
jgi:hypothetical protein